LSAHSPPTTTYLPSGGDWGNDAVQAMYNGDKIPHSPTVVEIIGP